MNENDICYFDNETYIKVKDIIDYMNVVNSSYVRTIEKVQNYPKQLMNETRIIDSNNFFNDLLDNGKTLSIIRIEIQLLLEEFNRVLY